VHCNVSYYCRHWKAAVEGPNEFFFMFWVKQWMLLLWKHHSSITFNWWSFSSFPQLHWSLVDDDYLSNWWWWTFSREQVGLNSLLFTNGYKYRIQSNACGLKATVVVVLQLVEARPLPVLGAAHSYFAMEYSWESCFLCFFFTTTKDCFSFRSMLYPPALHILPKCPKT